jgi:hypothetical protein
MMILKKHNGEGWVFNPNEPQTIIYFPERVGYSEKIPLHHTHTITDYEYLRQYFEEGHHIYDNFHSSFYFLLV